MRDLWVKLRDVVSPVPLGDLARAIISSPSATSHGHFSFVSNMIFNNYVFVQKYAEDPKGILNTQSPGCGAPLSYETNVADKEANE